MGTSISQGSERNANWRRVHVCYENSKIPEGRVVNELWKAIDNESDSITEKMKSKTVFEFYKSVEHSKNYKSALDSINNILIKNRSNTIVAEFAKRVVPMSFQGNNPSSTWVKNFFSEVTRYVVSRDAGGFLNPKHRFSNVAELSMFKRNISEKVAQVVTPTKNGVKSHAEWKKFVDQSISKLKTYKWQDS